MEDETKDPKERLEILVTRLAQKCSHSYVDDTDVTILRELFELTKYRGLALRLIEIENPSGARYPKSVGIGGVDYGFYKSSSAAEIAEKIGDKTKAIQFYKEAIERLDVLREESSDYKNTCFNGSDDLRLRAFYTNKITELTQGKQ